MKSSEQKLIINNILSSSEVLSKCMGIVEAGYFDPEYRNVIQFIKDYANKYNESPAFDVVNAKFDLDLKPRQITTGEINYTCKEIESFCQRQAMSNAVLLSVDDIEKGDFGAMMERIKAASEISLDADLGIEMFEDPEATLQSLLETDESFSTGIPEIDDKLSGGLQRKTLTLFSANSGGGKSVMLSNLGVNYCLSGLHVVYITLELPEKMVFKRNSFILTGVKSREWKENVTQMASKLIAIKHSGVGSLLIKRLPTSGTSANIIRAFLKQYEIEYKRRPDVIIVDYLDLMVPNEGIRNMSIWDQDKLKSEQIVQILHDYDAIGISASQQNRDALRMSSPDQGVIAGGMSKVNTVDNFISLYMNDTLRASGKMMAFFLKTRSSDGVGQAVELGFDPGCLRIGSLNVVGGGMKGLANRIKTRKQSSGIVELLEPVEGLPGITPEITSECKTDIMMCSGDDGVDVVISNNTNRELKDLSGIINGKKKKRKSAIEHLDEEEALTGYGKNNKVGQQDTQNKELPVDFAAALDKNNLGNDAREYILSFME